MDSNQTGRVHRILVVDDHPLVRAGLASLIRTESDLDVCGEAADSRSALQQIKSTRPDVAIVDLSLVGGSGLDLIERIKAHASSLPILALSMYDETLFAERALQAGARGYLNKQEPPSRVLKALRRVLAGKIYLSEAMTERLLLRASTTGDALPCSPLARLSNREMEVFEMIGRGMSVGKIAGYLNLSVKTIETHRHKIKQKLGLPSSRDLYRQAMQWIMEAAEGAESKDPASPC